MAKQYSKPFDLALDPAKTYTAVIKTNFGPFTVEFYPEDAPNTVNNFVSLAKDGYYDNTPFHRIIAGFVIQGGDPTGTGAGGPGYRFNDEPIAKDYTKGTLAMANAGPNTNGSQFFIVSGAHGVTLPPNYSIFGKLIDGFEVLSQLEKVRTGSGDRPVDDVVIESVTITES